MAKIERTLTYVFWVYFSISSIQYISVLIQTGDLLPQGYYGDYLRSIFTFSSDAFLVYCLFAAFFAHKQRYFLCFLALLAGIWANFISGVFLLLVIIGLYFIVIKPMHWVHRIGTLAALTLALGVFTYIYYDNLNYGMQVLSSLNRNVLLRKITAHLMTWDYWTGDIWHFLVGSGMGNFSSRAAFTAGGEYVSWYPSTWVWRSPAFAANHFLLWNEQILRVPFSDGTANQPFSMYNQLIGEYGLIGVVSFAVFYVGYYLRRLRRLSPIYKTFIPFLFGFMVLDYWFEYFSVLVFWELFLLMELRRNPQPLPKKQLTLLPIRIPLQWRIPLILRIKT